MSNAAPRSVASHIWETALDLVFPRRCVSCSEFGAFICVSCISGMTRAEPPRCPLCWMPVLSREALAEARVEGPSPAGKECYSCRARRPAISGTRSVFVYEGPARDAIHALKFRGLSAVAPEMAAQMAGLLTDWDPPAQSIVPVPLGGRRRRLRGYDQAELLAKELSRLTHLPLATRALVRRRATPPQARQESEDARRRNIVGAFAPGKYLPTGGVLLIDDVVTTGATLDACARVLLSEGIGPVFALTFAKDD